MLPVPAFTWQPGMGGKQSMLKVKIPLRLAERDIYIDGLVSTGNKFPIAILKIIFFNKKIFPKYFINILKRAVDNAAHKNLVPEKIKRR